MPVRKVTDPSILQQLNAGNGIVAPNPMFPGQMQGQQLQNQERAATLPYAAPKAAADASNAATQAQVNAATAPAEIATKGANARKSAVEATTAERNLETTGGANEGQAKSASFYTRAAKANQYYEGTGVTDEPMGHAVAQTLLPETVVNKFTSPERQQAEAAQRNFIAATLRYESGANLPPSEFETQRKVFFPAPGDDPATIALKAKMRRDAIEGLKVAAGPAGTVLEPQQGVAGTSLSDVAGAVLGKPQFRTEFDPQTSAGMDRLIRMGRPMNEIAAYAKQQGYPLTPDVMESVAQAKLYLKQNPKYKGGFTQATHAKPMSVGETISGSPLGAMGSAMGSAATLGFNDEIAGGINALRGGSYAEERDAFNAGKHLLADSHPAADFAGTALGSALTMGALGAGGRMAGLGERLAPAARYGQTAEQAANIGARNATILSDVGYGAGYGAGENNENRLLGAGEGGAAALGGNVAGRGLATTLGGLVSPTGGKLASLYDLGVRPSIGQRFGGVANNLEEKMQSFPFLGDMIAGTRQRARDQFQTGLFNKSLGEIGAGLPKGMGPGHDAHAFAQSAFGKAYDAAKSGMTVIADGPLATDLGNLQRTVSTLKPDSQGTFNKLWSDSVGRRFKGGSLSGEAFKDATSEIEKKIAKIRSSQSGDGELADALQEAVNALKGSAMHNSSPEAVAAMDAADRGYATLVQLETASKAAGGDAATFSPKQFENAVKNTNSSVRKRGYLAGNAPNTDIAEAGLRLEDKVSNSGTIDRLIPASLMGGLGIVSPKAAGAMTLYSLLNAPGVRNATTALLAPRRGKAKTLADLIREYSGAAGTIGSGVGVGLLPAR